MHFGQKAAEAQVEGLQHADVRAQVVTQRRGRGGRTVQGAAQVQVGEARGRKRAQVEPGQTLGPEPGVVAQEVARVRQGEVHLAQRVVVLLGGQEAALPQDRIHARVGEPEVLEIRHEPRLPLPGEPFEEDLGSGTEPESGPAAAAAAARSLFTVTFTHNY